MNMRELSCEQKLALALERRGMSDQQIAVTLGKKSREAVCRLRGRGRRKIAQSTAVTSGLMTVDQIIDYITAAITKPTPSLAMAIAG